MKTLGFGYYDIICPDSIPEISDIKIDEGRGSNNTVTKFKGCKYYDVFFNITVR